MFWKTCVFAQKRPEIPNKVSLLLTVKWRTDFSINHSSNSRFDCYTKSRGCVYLFLLFHRFSLDFHRFSHTFSLLYTQMIIAWDMICLWTPGAKSWKCSILMTFNKMNKVLNKYKVTQDIFVDSLSTEWSSSRDLVDCICWKNNIFCNFPPLSFSHEKKRNTSTKNLQS